MENFNRMYNFVESKFNWYREAQKCVARQKERHYHRCERKRFNGKTFRHKTKYIRGDMKYEIFRYIRRT
nr:MAG TPA: hypothetical protein [Caudoviricetes sp.]